MESYDTPAHNNLSFPLWLFNSLLNNSVVPVETGTQHGKGLPKSVRQGSIAALLEASFSRCGKQILPPHCPSYVSLFHFFLAMESYDTPALQHSVFNPCFTFPLFHCSTFS
jgi:hypothetical protein